MPRVRLPLPRPNPLRPIRRAPVPLPRKRFGRGNSNQFQIKSINRTNPFSFHVNERARGPPPSPMSRHAKPMPPIPPQLRETARVRHPISPARPRRTRSCLESKRGETSRHRGGGWADHGLSRRREGEGGKISRRPCELLGE